MSDEQRKLYLDCQSAIIRQIYSLQEQIKALQQEANALKKLSQVDTTGNK